MPQRENLQKNAPKTGQNLWHELRVLGLLVPSNQGLTLETSALKLFAVATLRYQLSSWY